LIQAVNGFGQLPRRRSSAASAITGDSAPASQFGSRSSATVKKRASAMSVSHQPCRITPLGARSSHHRGIPRHFVWGEAERRLIEL
jgi:hypothetical protein